MTRKFTDFESKMSPASRAGPDRPCPHLIAEMPLHELRRARTMSRVKLAESLHVNQAAISKIEHLAGMYIDTLRDCIRAVGGDLEITARFPDGAVKINDLADIHQTHGA